VRADLGFDLGRDSAEDEAAFDDRSSCEIPCGSSDHVGCLHHSGSSTLRSVRRKTFQRRAIRVVRSRAHPFLLGFRCDSFVTSCDLLGCREERADALEERADVLGEVVEL